MRQNGFEMWCFVQFTNAKDILATAKKTYLYFHSSIQLMYQRERERERESKQEANDEGKLVAAQKHLLL